MPGSARGRRGESSESPWEEGQGVLRREEGQGVLLGREEGQGVLLRREEVTVHMEGRLGKLQLRVATSKILILKSENSMGNPRWKELSLALLCKELLPYCCPVSTRMEHAGWDFDVLAHQCVTGENLPRHRARCSLYGHLLCREPGKN